LGKAALSTFDQGKRVSKNRAHLHLSDQRREMHANGENWRSLDNDEIIRNYVCSRNDAEDLIGAGICAIWAVFLFSTDPNTRLPHVPGRRFGWNAARFDWILERVDGSAVRIHPGRGIHGTPVYGNLWHWPPLQDGYSAPAATRGEAVKGSGKGGFTGIHQVDVLGRQDARKFLTACLETWAAQPHPRTQFAQCLLDGSRFPWWLYLNSTDWGRELAPKVKEFGMCWLLAPNRPCFYVQCWSGKWFILDVLGDNRRPFEAVADLDSVASFD